MRHQVPFVGERKLIRGNDEQAPAKRARGRVIDDVVANGFGESSWEDVVPAGWVDKALPPPAQEAEVATPASARASIIRPKPAAPLKSRVPLKPGNKTLSPGKVDHWNFSDEHTPAGNYNARAAIDWVLIKNDRCYRVNIRGCIDHNLREDWARFMAETAKSTVREFEFNLMGTPALSLTGLGLLLLFKERKGCLRDEITICNCNRNVEQLLRWAGMENYFTIQSGHITRV